MGEHVELRRFTLAVALVVCFQGLRILLLPSYQSKAAGAAMILVALAYLRHHIRFLSKPAQKSILYPLVGVSVIVGDLAYNLAESGMPGFNSLDQMMLLFGLSLILYPLTPERYAPLMRFTVTFFATFTVLLVLPLLLLPLGYGEAAMGWYLEVFLTKPLALLLRTAGVPASVHLNWIFYSGAAGNVSLGIGIACSGAYTFAVFASAYAAYILNVRPGLDWRVAGLLAYGIAVAYAGNLLRMTAIGLAGYYWGTAALIQAHQNMGWIIFMALVAPLWYLGFRFLGGIGERA